MNPAKHDLQISKLTTMLLKSSLKSISDAKWPQ